MKKITLLLALLVASFSFGQDLIITGIFDGSLTGGTPKTIEIYAINDIADLSTYGIGSANNGGGTDGIEFQLTGSATAGDYFYIASEQPQFNAFFGFDPDFVTSAANNNGDDAIELFNNVVDDGMGGLTGTLIDTFGDINTDGSGEPWEYMDGWAYRVDGTGPDGATFILGNWTYSGINANDDDTTQAGATNPWPIGTYSDMASEDPSLTISTPATDQTFPAGTTSVDVVFSTMNFDLTGANVVEYTINGGAVETTQASPIAVATEDGMAYTVSLELKDASGSLTPPVTATATFSVGELVTVSTIAELRALADGTEAVLSGEGVLTFQQDFRNQKWIQDVTGAIALDDNPGTITTTYAIGDGISGISGIVGSFAGFKQFVPNADPGAATSTGNTITPEIVTADMLNANPEDYESELVTIEDATIDNTPSTTWTTGEEFPMATTNGDYVFRTSFFDVDYIDTTVPTAAVNVTGIITERNNGDYFITSRNQADIVSATGCPLVIGAITFECTTNTDGIDESVITIEFTGGGSEVYTTSIISGPGLVAGDDPSSAASGSIILTDVSESTTITLSISSDSCDITQDITTPACDAELEAATLAELRAGTLGETYTLTGEAVLTFQQDFRNQKFVEDATAGILIDDSPGIITTAFNIGDGITGVRGTLNEFNGMLQFSPIEDPGAATSTGNPVEPQMVTSTELMANPNDFESEYVELVQVFIDNTIPNWETGTEYILTTPAGDYTFRTTFFDADYIGQEVPTTESNIAGIITERNNGDYFITARDAADITEFLSVNENTLTRLSIFPNPSTDFVTIQTAIDGQKGVEVYDITGKKIIETVTSSTVDVRELAPGLYILKVSQNNTTASLKLIIK